MLVNELMKELHIKYELHNSWKELPMEEQRLVENAYEVAANAYAPYSKFHVGAATLLDDGTIVLGSNQENIAFPSGMCAERTALFYAGANYPDKKIEKLIIVAKGDFVTMETLLSPCGGCRQVIVESETRQATPIKIILVSQNEQTLILYSAKDLLPFAFLNAK